MTGQSLFQYVARLSVGVRTNKKQNKQIFVHEPALYLKEGIVILQPPTRRGEVTPFTTSPLLFSSLFLLLLGSCRCGSY